MRWYWKAKIVASLNEIWNIALYDKDISESVCLMALPVHSLECVGHGKGPSCVESLTFSHHVFSDWRFCMINFTFAVLRKFKLLLFVVFTY